MPIDKPERLTRVPMPLELIQAGERVMQRVYDKQESKAMPIDKDGIITPKPPPPADPEHPGSDDDSVAWFILISVVFVMTIVCKLIQAWW